MANPFTQFAFPATGTGTMTRRTQPDRLADVINVKDWNATGNGSTDDVIAIQAAIDYAQSPTDAHGSPKQPGGIVFFPPGTYSCSQALQVGSNTTQNAGVRLVGCGSPATNLKASVSKGSRTYDNFHTIEGMTVTGPIVLEGYNQQVLDVVVGGNAGTCDIDASRAQGAYICGGGGFGGTNLSANHGPSSTGASGAVLGSIYVALGNQCTCQDTRTVGGRDITYVLSGYNPSLIGSSTETCRRGVRVGWAPSFTLNTSASASAGTNVLTFASLPVGGVTIGRYVSGTNIPSRTYITDVNYTAFTITLSANIQVGGVASNATITFQNECPAYGPFVTAVQTERCDFATELYNCQGGFISGTVNQAQIGSTAQDPATVIDNITWAAGVATVTTHGAHNMVDGKQILQILPLPGAQSQFLPSYANPPGWVIATFDHLTMGPTTFTYDLPVNPAVTYTAGTQQWTYPQYYAFRMRKVYDTVIMGLNAGGNFALANIDLNFDDSVLNGVISGDPDVQFRNVTLWSCTPYSDGAVLPTNKTNLAGINFNSVGGSVNPLEGHGSYTGKSTVASPDSQMVFANLPDGQVTVFQPGPYEGQEFNIKDAQTQATFGGVVSGGGSTNHYRVRYVTGTGWTRIG